MFLIFKGVNMSKHGLQKDIEKLSQHNLISKTHSSMRQHRQK